MFLAFTLVAASCGGGSDSDSAATDPDSDPAATQEESDAVPTTPPVPVPADDEEAEEADLSAANFATPVPVDNGLGPTTPYENIVLHVNDDVQIVPAFDAPHGNPITLYDINVIDNIELEYPLYAETVFGNRLALRVEEYDSTGAWARVSVPIRPNGTTAWVQTAFFHEERHDYHITIDISENKVNVYKGEDLIVEQIAVSGRESRPTPVVRSYIDEKIPGETLSPAYGTWILSIAAFSEALGTFGEAMPKLALHGTNQPDLMGQYISSGCVRVPNDVIDFIAATVPVGATVDIVA